MGHSVYLLPCKPGSIFVNLGTDCLNDCRFCVRRYRNFFGYDLNVPHSGDTARLIEDGLKRIRALCEKPKEIVICGYGEPFLHFGDVITAAKTGKGIFGQDTLVRADTNGLWWPRYGDMSFLDYVTSLSVSLNAENSDKYNRICQSRVPDAYSILWRFLGELVNEREQRTSRGEHFPDVRLTVVDTSEKMYMPPREQADPVEDCPVPDFERCREIANQLGFPLVVKRLFRDAHECDWNPKIVEATLDGAYLEKCIGCKHRHI